MARETESPERDALEGYLRGIDFPADRDDVVRGAERNDAPSGVLMKLRNLPDDEFEDSDDVVEAVPATGGTSQRAGGTPESPVTRVQQPGQRDPEEKPTGGRERTDRER